MTEQTDVLLLGLDGVGFSEIGDWLENDRLPHLSSILEEGIAADLKSTVPPMTPTAWPSLASGVNPGKHGIYDFFTLNKYDKSLINRSKAQTTYIWEFADESGLTPVVINFPVTYPATKLGNGALVPGYLSPEDTTFYPQGLREKFESEYGTYRLYPNYKSDAALVDELCGVAQCRRDMARFLDRQYDWDLLAIQFQVTDSVFHATKDRDKIRQVYESVDSYIGDILELVETDTDVFIVSDHGMGDYEWRFHINSWLAESGYCHIVPGTPTQLSEVKARLSNDRDTKSQESSVHHKGATILSKIGVTPKRVHKGLSAFNLMPLARIMIPDAMRYIASEIQTVDWENSQAYLILTDSWGIHINRDAISSISPTPDKEYEKFREKLIGELNDITDPNGNKVFKNVKRREEVYNGTNVEMAPDLILFPHNWNYDINSAIVDVFSRHEHKNHKPNGIFIGQGPQIESDSDISTVSIYDIAPTIAAVLDLPVNSEGDGNVLPIVSKTTESINWSENTMLEYVDNGSTTNPSTEVTDMLEDLGYLGGSNK